LYDLHPVDLQTRVEQALEKLQPSLQSHGGSAQLLRVTPDGAVTIGLAGKIQSCGTSPAALRSSVEQAIYDAAPEATALIIEGEILDAGAAAAFVPLSTLSGDSEHALAHKSAAAGQTDRKEA
jgi:Fe-S cluster biogenesis protein NfuA